MTDLLSIIKTIPLVMADVTRCLAEMSDDDIFKASHVLFAAIDTNNKELCEKLMNRPFDFSITDKYDDTILHYAMKYDMNDIAMKLIDVLSVHVLNIQNHAKNTALHAALSYKATNVAMKLIERGVDVNLLNNEIKSVLNWAINNRIKDVALILVEKSTIDTLNVINNYGNTVLHRAIDECMEDIAIRLIERGVDLNTKNTDNENTALHCALHQNLNNVVIRLLECGADTSIVNVVGNTALQLAINISNYDMALLLIEKSTIDTLNIKNNNGNTALHRALDDDATNVIRALCAKGVDVHIKNSHGQTALQRLVAKYVIPDKA